MATTSTDAELARSMMTLCGGILTITAAVVTIVHRKLEKAKNAAQRQSIIDVTISVLSIGTTVLGVFLSLAFGAHRAGFSFMTLGVFLTLINFFYARWIVTRIEVFNVSLIAAFATSVVLYFVVQKIMDKQLDLIRLTNERIDLMMPRSQTNSPSDVKQGP